MQRGKNEEIPRSNWTTPIVSYLKNGTLLDDKAAARKLKVQVALFVLIKDVSYKKQKRLLPPVPKVLRP